MTDLDATAAMVRAPSTLLEVHPVRGLPDIRPGDDVAGALADAFPYAAGDVVVVTVFEPRSCRQQGQPPSPGRQNAVPNSVCGCTSLTPVQGLTMPWW